MSKTISIGENMVETIHIMTASAKSNSSFVEAPDDIFNAPTPDEIARRLAAIEAFDDKSTAERDEPHLDLSVERDRLYGYSEREKTQ